MTPTTPLPVLKARERELAERTKREQSELARIRREIKRRAMEAR